MSPELPPSARVEMNAESCGTTVLHLTRNERFRWEAANQVPEAIDVAISTVKQEEVSIPTKERPRYTPKRHRSAFIGETETHVVAGTLLDRHVLFHGVEHDAVKMSFDRRNLVRFPDALEHGHVAGGQGIIKVAEVLRIPDALLQSGGLHD